MNRQLLNQLDKILALVDSDHDGEALVAVRKARRMLSNDGLSFGDLARAAAQKPRTHFPFSLRSTQSSNLEADLAALRQRLDDLHVEMQAQDMQINHWRRRAVNLEQKLATMQDEAGRWRQLARDTVEKLWDLGLAVQQYDVALNQEKAKKA
jgi:hypothetical protein